MKIRKLTAIILVVVLLATTCCGLLSACSNKSSSSGNGVYQITFNANGGTVSPTSAETTDGKLASLPTPYKENTEFLGWYLSSVFNGERLTVDYTYSFSCIIHAKWGETQSTEYYVTFDGNGGTLAAGTENMETVDGRLLALPADPTPPNNCTFVGWYTEKTVGERVDTSYEFTGETREVTVYAHYIQEYLITFDAGVGTINEESRLTVNGKLSGALPTPTGVPTDKTFVAWYTQKTGGKRVKSNTVFSSDCTIYALYLEEGEYIVTIDANGGTIAGDIEEMFTTDAKLGELPTPTPPVGYEFVGWFTEKTGGVQVDADTDYSNIEIIYAQYLLVEFIVSFDAGKGTLSEATVMMTVGKKLERMPYRPFAPAGFMFVGWYTEKDGGEKVDTNYVFTGTPGARTLHAHYDTAIIRGDGIWMDGELRGEFKPPSAGDIWAYDIDFRGEDVALEFWYNGELIVNITRDEYSTDKVVLTPDKMLRLANGADISDSIINVLYRYSSNIVYIQEIKRADIRDNDGIYVGTTKIKPITQNIAKPEVMAKDVVIGSGGTTEMTIVLGGKTVDIAHFRMEPTVKAQLSLDRKNIIVAAGTYTIYYNYGTTDTSSIDYKDLWIDGNSTGNLPDTGELVDSSPYYMVGAAAALELGWETIASVSLIPDNVHLRKMGDGIYSITVDLYEGNQFKILKAGNGWTGEYNYQNLDGNIGSTKYFTSSNELDGKNDNNIVVVTSGNYTITLNESTRRLTFVRHGEAANIKLAYDIYIHGSFTASWENRIAAYNRTAGTITFDFALTEGLDFGIRTTLHSRSKQVCWASFFQVTANNTDGAITKAMLSNDLTCTKTGTYRFTFTLDNNGQVTSIKIDTVL